jgi:hypothetical protein
VNAAASTAEWLRAATVGAGFFTVVAVAMKTALDGLPHRAPAPAPQLTVEQPVCPADLEDLQPLTTISRVQPYRARHSKGPSCN